MISGMSGSQDRKWVPNVGCPEANLSRNVLCMIIVLVLNELVVG